MLAPSQEAAPVQAQQLLVKTRLADEDPCQASETPTPAHRRRCHAPLLLLQLLEATLDAHGTPSCNEHTGSHRPTHLNIHMNIHLYAHKPLLLATAQPTLDAHGTPGRNEHARRARGMVGQPQQELGGAPQRDPLPLCCQAWQGSSHGMHHLQGSAAEVAAAVYMGRIVYVQQCRATRARVCAGKSCGCGVTM